MAIINPLLTKLTKLVRSRYMAGCCHIRLVLFLLFDWPGLPFGSKNVKKKLANIQASWPPFLLVNNAICRHPCSQRPGVQWNKHHGEKIFCINIKLWNLRWWENETLQSISKSAEQTQKSKKFASLGITAHILFSEASYEQNGANWGEPFEFFQTEFFFLLLCFFGSRGNKNNSLLNECIRPASYPDVSLLMKMCAQRKAGRRQRSAACTLPMVSCSSSPVTPRVSRSPLPCEKRSAWGGVNRLLIYIM